MHRGVCISSGVLTPRKIKTPKWSNEKGSQQWNSTPSDAISSPRHAGMTDGEELHIVTENIDT